MNIVHTGIFFNGIISFIVGITAVALALFSLRRWWSLSSTMRAYAWFWLTTTLVWLPTSLRYFLISSDYTGGAIHTLTILSQAGVAASGPALLYYLCTHHSKGKFWAITLTTLSSILGAIALWVDAQPGGIIIQPATYFSAEIGLNSFSFSIFLIIIAVIYFLVLRDIGFFYAEYKKRHDQQFLYEVLYSVAIGVYLLLGSFEEAGMVSNWPVLVFRSLYVGTFLYVYIVMEKSESIKESYLIDSAATLRQ
ncbi:MAG: hypothetical protein WC817_04490 [Patescibacteria group bacterium]|jgi:hypothetical protein